MYPVPKAWDIPESIRHRLGIEAGPQRSIFEDGHLLVILHHIPKPDQTDRVPAFFWRNAAGEWRSTEGKGMGPVALQNFMDAWENKTASSGSGRAEEHDGHRVSCPAGGKPAPSCAPRAGCIAHCNRLANW